MPAENVSWPVTLFRGARDNRPRARTWDEETMVRALAIHRVWTGEKVNAPAWSPVKMRPGTERRAKKNVESVSMLVLDCDSGESVETLEALGDDFVRLGHTSWSHSTGHPKARLVFPFKPGRPCPAEEWPDVWSAASRWAAEQGVAVDVAAKDPSRLYFGPYVPPGGLETAERWVYGPYENSGANIPARERKWLSWAWLVTAYPPPEEELDDFGPMVKFTAGSMHDSDERHDRRRRSFARGLVRYRAEKLARSGQGGRNASLFGAARLVRQLESAGALDGATALGELQAAALQSGLPAQEVRRTIASGYAAGGSDPAFDIDREMGE